MRGVSLEVGQVVELSIDGTIVFVEDVQRTFAGVVALPEQPDTRTDSIVFTAGRVGLKKISPFSSASAVIDAENLSEVNNRFIAEYRELREKHGPNHIVWSDKEKSKMSVRKAGPAPKVRLSRAERKAAQSPEAKQARREERRALKKKCAQCDQPRSKHDATTDHEFVPKAGRAPRGESKRAQRAASKSSKYVVAHSDLTKAQAQSDKFKPGNRFYRVFRALEALCARDASGATLEQVCDAVDADGGRAMTDTAKVVRRALKQLTSAACGEAVQRAR